MSPDDSHTLDEDWKEQGKNPVDEKVALGLAAKLARNTGRTVEVRNTDGFLVATYRGATKHNREVPGP